MTSLKYASAAGRKYETDLMKHLRERGLDVERLRLTGAEDEGDLLVRFNGPLSGTLAGPRRLVIEAKRTKAMDLGGWIKEAEVERDHYDAHRGNTAPSGFVVVHYRRQHGVGRSYVTSTLDEYLRQIGAA